MPAPDCPHCGLSLVSPVVVATVHAWALREGGGFVVVPKRHVARLTDLDDPEYLGVMDLALTLARAQSAPGVVIRAPIGDAAGQHGEHAFVEVSPAWDATEPNAPSGGPV